MPPYAGNIPNLPNLPNIPKPFLFFAPCSVFSPDLAFWNFRLIKDKY